MTADRVAGFVLILLGLFVVEETWRLRYPLGSVASPGPAFVPLILALLVLGCGAVLAVVGAGTVTLAGLGWGEWRHAAAIFGACAFAALAMERLGYRLTVFVLLAFLLGVVERKHPVFAAAFAVVLAWATFFLFNTLLRVPLPRGPLGL